MDKLLQITILVLMISSRLVIMAIKWTLKTRTLRVVLRAIGVRGCVTESVACVAENEFELNCWTLFSCHPITELLSPYSKLYNVHLLTNALTLSCTYTVVYHGSLNQP